MEQQGLRVLLAPLFVGRKLKVHWSDRYLGREDLLNKLPKLVRVAARESSDPRIIVLVDYLPQNKPPVDCEAYRRRIRNRVDKGLQRLVSAHLAVPDIEGWLLAERSSLAHELNIDERAIPAVDAARSAVEQVIRLFRSAKRDYRKTREGVRILGQLDRGKLCDRCPEAHKFFEEVELLCGLDRDAIS